MKDEAPFSAPQWAILELFGHTTLAGQVSEATVAGSSVLRIDVPPAPDRPAFTKFLTMSAIFGITPTDQATALAAVRHLRANPIEPWRLGVDSKQLPTGDEHVY